MRSVIVLNGGSSSGKSGIARCLQAVLPDPWLAIGVDTLIQVMPATKSGIEFGADGSVNVGPEFARIELAWMAGVGAMVRAGARVIVDDVFLSGAASRRRWEPALDSLDVLWVGVRCAAEAAEAREIARGDRVVGMARAQAETVHAGMTYDVEVDTTHSELLACARIIARAL